MNNRLPPQIVALIHHTELNKAGWFDTHKKHAISSIFWLQNKSLTPEGIITHQEDVGLTGLGLPETTQLLNSLCTDDVLIQLNADTYRLTQDAYDQITREVESAEELERDVIAHFHNLFEQSFRPYLSMDAEKLWDVFQSDFLAPLIEFFGARTYEILTGDTTDIDQAPFTLQFLNKFSSDQRPYIRQLFEAFLDPSSDDFRSYTLRLLNSHFFSIANRYRRENLDALYSGAKKPIIRCLLDTNFLYSILDLHDNPSNEAANALLETIERARKYIDVRLYVFPPTINELKRSLAFHEDLLSRILVTRAISNAVVEGAVSGVTLKFIRECQRSGFSLTAKDYFEPYHHNLSQILGERGIHIFNENTDHYSLDQRVIDDALDQQAFFMQRHRIRKLRGKAKSYEQIWHDMLLWYFIFDKRPAHVDSIVDVDAIGVTIDYSLIGFDSFKQRRNLSRIPVFIHPATLIQLLQFFVPADQSFEAAIVDTLRMPFLLREFDADTEKTTVRILTRLSRFENVDDLSPSTIRHILQNEILRNQLEGIDEEEGEIQLIREALIEENARAKSELEDAKRREDELLVRVNALSELSEDDKRSIVSLKNALEQESQDKEKFGVQINSLKRDAEKRKMEAERDTTRSIFFDRFVKYPGVVLAAGILFIVFRNDNLFTLRNVLLYSVPIMTIALAWLFGVWLLGRTRKHIMDWWWFKRLHSIRYALGAIAMSVYVGLWVAAYWDLIKGLIENT